MHINKAIPDAIVSSYLGGQWYAPDDGATAIKSAVTGEVIAHAGHNACDADLILNYAKKAMNTPAKNNMKTH